MSNWGAKLMIRYRMISIHTPPPAKWRVATVPPTRTFSLTTWKSALATCWFVRRVGEGHYEWLLGLAHFHNEYSFLMISPKLYDISLLFLLIPSPLWTVHLLSLIRLLGDGYSLLGSQNSLRGTIVILYLKSRKKANFRFFLKWKAKNESVR